MDESAWPEVITVDIGPEADAVDNGGVAEDPSLARGRISRSSNAFVGFTEAATTRQRPRTTQAERILTPIAATYRTTRGRVLPCKKSQMLRARLPQHLRCCTVPYLAACKIRRGRARSKWEADNLPRPGYFENEDSQQRRTLGRIGREDSSELSGSKIAKFQSKIQKTLASLFFSMEQSVDRRTHQRLGNDGQSWGKPGGAALNSRDSVNEDQALAQVNQLAIHPHQVRNPIC